MRWASTRNKINPDRPAWTDPLQRLWYRVYKAGDRANLRWQDFYRRRVLGLHRLPKEHFQVFVMRAGDAAPVAIPAPPLSYYADPFLRRVEGRLWLFVEEFEYAEQRGRLVAMELDAALAPGPAVPILRLREHASYPFVFEADGALYLLPETCAMGALDLYRCERFPDRWRRVRRLLDAVDAVDATLHRDEAGWVLICCARPVGASGGRTLQVYRCADLLSGELTADPVTAQGWHAGAQHGFGRGAGDVLEDLHAGPEGRLLRPIQASRAYYGQAAAARVATGSAGEGWREQDLAADHPLARILSLTSPHHLSVAGSTIAFDLRTRLGFVSGLPWLGRRLNGLDPAAKRFLSGSPEVNADLARLVPDLLARVRPRHGL